MSELKQEHQYLCKEAVTKDEILQAILLRRQVLVKEFQYSWYKYEPDAFDLISTIYVVKKGEKVVGTVRVCRDGESFRVQRIAIDREYRLTGIGSLLLQKILRHHKKCYVMSPEENIPFYERFGFIKTGEIKKGKHHAFHVMRNY